MSSPLKRSINRSINRRIFLASSAALAGGLTMQTATPVHAAPVTDRASDPTIAPTLDIDIEIRQAARNDPSEATLAEAAVLIRRGKLKATELTEAYLERIERYDGTYQAYAEVTAEDARAAARRADRTSAGRRLLHGIPSASRTTTSRRAYPPAATPSSSRTSCRTRTPRPWPG